MNVLKVVVSNNWTDDVNDPHVFPTAFCRAFIDRTASVYFPMLDD